MTKIGIVSLGCPRNLVDSEVMLGSLKKEGYEIADEVGDGVDLFIINTCSFVESAREESVDTVIEAAALKREGKIRYLVICGCLPQLYGKKLLKNLPEVDAIIGTSDIPKMGMIVKALLKDDPKPGSKNFPALARSQRCVVSKELKYLYNENSPRLYLTPSHFVYLKISEGCDNLCSYCIIPRLRGKFRSRSIESVIEEAKNLSLSGKIREINIIGQDTTLFGKDIYGGKKLPELLKRIASLKSGVKWIRLLYTHPAHYSGRLIDTLRDEKKICGYLDLPIQHISDPVLKKMNRHTTRKEIICLIEKLRKNIPDLTLRTSVIIGFPGETDKEFKELMAFLEDTRFEKLGAFIYSAEDLSRAYKFPRHVPDKIKNERFDEVMKLQQKISADINRSYMGKIVNVLIDEPVEGSNNKFTGRTEGDAPEVDGCVYVSGKGLKVGEFFKVKITDTLEYDLVGEAV
ncbi:MAG: 30S ribosomal protein S12 methylthiotransferase RimO [Candidatus Omnitrophica bacterium]|nr:30S ribosomal protein S12 methylthiotransferase RimO [Candidatus Omnitrophota bacterium]